MIGMSAFDQAKSEMFAEKMVRIVNDAAIALMISIGHQTGLFDTMADLPPSTSDQIADTAKLNERYVREWLGTMVTGRIVDYDPGEGTYFLPPEHAAWLTRAAGRDNFGPLAEGIAPLAIVEEDIVSCFRAGGGVPYSAHQSFQRVLAEDRGAVYDESLIDKTLPLVPGLVEQLQDGIIVADVGCGHGHALNLMAKAFPASQFIGYDFLEESIEAGQSEAAELGLSNARFELKDVAMLDVSEEYHFITAFDAIHDQAQPATVLKAIAKALRPGGTFLMADVAASSKLEENLELTMGPLLYTISTMHCTAVSLALDGAGLGAMWGEQKAQQMLADAGFTRVEILQIEADPVNNYYIARKS